MHAAAIALISGILLGQVGGDYGDGASELGPRMSVSSTTRTRSTRATGANPNAGGEGYRPTRVAANPARPNYEPTRTTYENSLPPVGSARVVQDDSQSSLADKLLRDMIQPTRGDQNVQPLQLVQSLERVNGSQQQFSAIKAYWEWSLAVSELHGVLEENEVFTRISNPRTAHDQAAHTANLKASDSRMKDSQLDVADKVVDLFEATGVRSNTIRPADVPFVGVYNTNFTRIFPNAATAPVTLKKIHQTLPYALRVVRSRAESFEAARVAMLSGRDAYQANQCPYDDLVNSIALVRSQRRAFLDAVHDYNFEIAEYALSIAGPGLERQTVVSMLIRTASSSPYRGASMNYDGDVLPVSGEETFGGQYGSYRIAPEDSLLASEPPAGLGDQPVLRQVPGMFLR